MNFVKFLVALVAALALGPLSVSGALSSLPIGSKEKVVIETTQIDFVDLHVWLLGEAGKDTEIYNESFSHFVWDDGREESFRDMSRRSRADFENALSIGMRGIVHTLLKQSAEGTLRDKRDNPLDLKGRQIELAWNGDKFVNQYEFLGFFSVRRKAAVSQNTSGELELPEEAYKVDLASAILSRIGIWLLVPGIQQARLLTKDEQGNTLLVLEGSREFDPEGITIVPKWNLVVMPMRPAVSGTLGEIRTWYRDGSEQAFSLSDGSNLITYLSPPASPPFRRSGVPFLNREGQFVLPYEAQLGITVQVERTTNLDDPQSWRAVSGIRFVPPRSPAGASAVYGPVVHQALVPMDGSTAFYRLRDQESVAAQKQ